MYKLRQIWLTAISNFRRWRRSPQVILAFCLAFVVCFLLSDKVVTFAKAHDTLIQAAEPFIWTFGDAKSVLIILHVSFGCVNTHFSEIGSSTLNPY